MMFPKDFSQVATSTGYFPRSVLAAALAPPPPLQSAAPEMV